MTETLHSRNTSRKDNSEMIQTCFISNINKILKEELKKKNEWKEHYFNPNYGTKSMMDQYL